MSIAKPIPVSGASSASGSNAFRRPIEVPRRRPEKILGGAFRCACATVVCAVLLSCGGGSSADPAVSGSAQAGQFTLLAWNDLGMHCIDRDYSVFSLLPPYNNLHAQLIYRPEGRAVTSGVRITYEATADTAGSINSSSWQKTNFWDWALSIFGASLPKDVGLTGNPVPRAIPAAMIFDAAAGYWKAEGIPVVPYDDTGKANYYPMVKVVATDTSGRVLASTKAVLPISDEMTCVQCHASDTGDPAAQPEAGWVSDPNPDKDWKRNILSRHDDRNLPDPAYTAALAANGYRAAGLLATSDAGKPILCANCHASNALGKPGIPETLQLTSAVHSWHGTHAMDDATGLPLDDSTSRTACYLCHPGSTTQCLRGAMGKAVDSTGALLLQCQSCHGTMSVVGAVTRNGWLDLPRCDGCHYPSNGAGGYVQDVSAFSSPGVWRQPNGIFVTGSQLYKAAATHGMQCQACHGSTHAEYASAETNDNVQSIAAQGYAGEIAECTLCHAAVPLTKDGGPHGMHTVGQAWTSRHGDFVHDAAPCGACHGSAYGGTFLSKTRTARSFAIADGPLKSLDAGHMVSCYDCHNGPSGGG
jgi:hypothetical protein